MSANPPVKPEVWKFTVLFDMVTKSPAGTLAVAPPPVKYLTVNVVLEGAIP